MSRTFRIAWVAILLLAAIIWLTDFFRLIFDANYELERLPAIVACLISAWWTTEVAISISKDD